jgi:hypothetical protein
MSDEIIDKPVKHVKKHVLPEAMEKTKWKKGVSGNPNGRRPKEDTMSDCIREYLAGIVKTENGEKLTRMQIAVRAMYKKAISGDASMFKEMLDRGFGKIKENVDINSVQTIQFIDPEEKNI